jgi:hypothetical protein
MRASFVRTRRHDITAWSHLRAMKGCTDDVRAQSGSVPVHRGGSVPARSANLMAA